nr:zinc finger, CCHC-type [Tanacetum cinerariifolium]
MSVVYVLTTPMLEEGGENPTVEQVRRRAKGDNDDYVCIGLILNGMSDSLFDVCQNVETFKELWDTLEAKYMAEDASSKKFLDSNKPKGNNDAGPSVVSMVERNNSSRYNDNKGGNVGNKANGSGIKGSRDGSSNPLKGQNMFNESLQIYYVTYASEVYFMQDDDAFWWVNSGETVYVCKDRCWFKTYELLNDGSILQIGNESTSLVHGRSYVDLRFSFGKFVSFLNVLHVHNIRKNLVSSSILNNCGYKQVIESNKFVLSKHGAFIGFGYLSNHMFRLNIVCDNIGSAFMSTSKVNDSILWHARLGHVQFKRIQDMSKDRLILAFDMDTENCKTFMLTKITKKLFQNVKHEIKVLELIYSDLCDLHATPLLWNKKYFMTFIDDASRFKADKGGKYMDTMYFDSVGIIHETNALYTPQQNVTINSIIESKDAIFDEHRTLKDFGPEFQLYLIEGTRDEIFDQHSYCFNVEDDPKTFDEAMNSQDVAFWKEAINDEMDYIMGNNTLALTDLPLGIDYFDTYAPVARISAIRLLIAMASIHNLIIHQMDMKTSFLNRELEEEVYMNQPLGFIMPGNENKVDLTKEFLSSRFFMKDMREVDVILGIRIKHESNGIAISQSHYIEKVLKKFNYSDCTPVSIPLDTCEKLMPNKGLAVSQLEYSRVISCLM